jgi:hypothetical protein
MSKSRSTNLADNNGSPIGIPGDCCPFMLATGAVDRLKRRSRPVKGPLSPACDSVNAFLQFCFKTWMSVGNLRFWGAISDWNRPDHVILR